MNLLLLFCLLIGQTFGGIINVPNDYEHIQNALDAAADNDTVLVAPGTYYENLLLPQHEISLGSYFILTGDTSYVSQTILDGGNISSVILIDSPPDELHVITGFTITNGGNHNGGGICIYGGNADLSYLDIHHNGVGPNVSLGGGIYIDTSPIYSITIDHLKIRHNAASS